MNPILSHCLKKGTSPISQIIVELLHSVQFLNFSKKLLPLSCSIIDLFRVLCDDYNALYHVLLFNRPNATNNDKLKYLLSSNSL